MGAAHQGSEHPRRVAGTGPGGSDENTDADRWALGLALAILAGSAYAQAYPSKPIRVVLPYVAGGNADITARTIAQKLGESLGVSVLVDNRPGANGGIGTDVVAKAAPDGYTLLHTASGPIVVNPVLYAKVPYDPVKDFAPIVQVHTFMYVLVVEAASPIKSVGDLTAAAKARPGALSFGSTGIGGGNHLAGELFALMTGTKLAARPVQGQRSGARRPARRPALVHVRHADHFGAAPQDRQAARLRGDRAQARRRACPTFRRSTSSG